MPSTTQPPPTDSPPFRVWPLVSIVLLLLLGISLANQWYADNIAMPRYCDDPVETTVTRVQRLMTERHPADDSFEARRPYIVASKLLFLLPRDGNEGERDYLERIRQHLHRECR